MFVTTYIEGDVMYILHVVYLKGGYNTWISIKKLYGSTVVLGPQVTNIVQGLIFCA